MKTKLAAEVTFLEQRIVEHWQLRQELLAWLDKQTITSYNLGEIRRSLSGPWDSIWNAIVREETAQRENAKTERNQP
jgi:hypothetical protein